MNKTVIEIIKKNLIEEGFDGLYNEDLLVALSSNANTAGELICE